MGIHEGTLIFRLLLATILGGLIGFEREVSNRPAGLRTHILVTLGSCLIMILSMYGFSGLGVGGAGGEPARLASQVVSGIGFLGAGTIMREGNNVRGLTTAASLWISGGIGLAVGSGLYLGAFTTTIIVLFSLASLGIAEKRMVKLKRYAEVRIQGTGRPGFIGDIGTVFGNFHINIKNINIVVENNLTEDENGYEKNIEIIFHIRVPAKLDRQQLYERLNAIPGVEHITWDDTEAGRGCR